jgi:hypothetical protein
MSTATLDTAAQPAAATIAAKPDVAAAVPATGAAVVPDAKVVPSAAEEVAAAKVAADAKQAADAKTIAGASAKADETPAGKSLLSEAAAAEAAEAAKADEAKPADAAAEIVLTAPEKSPLTADDVKAVTELAKANKWTKEQAQAALETQHKTVLAVQARQEAKLKADYNAMYDTYAGEIKADKVYGGDKLPETLAAAKRTLRAFVSAEDRAVLEATPFGNHPILIRILAKVGAQLGEGAVLSSTGAAPKKEADPRVFMFPSLQKP